MPHTHPARGKESTPVLGQPVRWAPPRWHGHLQRWRWRTLPACTWQGTRGKQVKSSRPSLPHVLPQHRDLLTHFQLVSVLSPLACIALAHRVNKCCISGQPFARGSWGRACCARAEGRGVKADSPSMQLEGLHSHAVCRNWCATTSTWDQKVRAAV